jgi:hypothetical protein
MKEKFFYKLRHKPTGMFFKPSSHGDKRNLSHIGKTYSVKPSVNHLGNIFYIGYGGYGVPWSFSVSQPTSAPVIPSDWEIVIYKMVVDRVEQCK